MLKIRVIVTNPDGTKFRDYVMDHDKEDQRRTLGAQCRNAFEAGQSIQTIPLKK